jgi:hypothetical protein
MSDITKNPVEIPGATVPFFTYQEGETQVYEFDTSRTGPPEPMVNAMSGLKMIDDASKKLVMFNHKMPAGLFDKIGENFNIVEEMLEDGRAKVTFTYKAGESEKADLEDSDCHGDEEEA